jgi:hypothetical protein
LVWAVDGLAHYVTAIREGFRAPLPARRRGRPHLLPWPDIAIVQVVKRRAGEGLSIERRIVQGSSHLIADLLHRTQGTHTINTACIERLNATFRQCLACLARRSRALLRAPQTLQPALYLVVRSTTSVRFTIVCVCPCLLDALGGDIGFTAPPPWPPD